MLHVIGMLAQQLFNRIGRAVASPDPHDLGRNTSVHTALVKIRILRNDDVAVGSRVIPYSVVVGPLQSGVLDMRLSRKHLSQPTGKRRREILVEQQFHAYATS